MFTLLYQRIAAIPCNRAYSFWVCMICSILTTGVYADTTNYSNMQNWVAHPNKVFSVLGNYNLDIGVIGASNTLSAQIEVPNQYKTQTGVDIFFIHPTILDRYYDFEGNIAIDSQPLAQISATVIAQAGLLAQFSSFYAPFYRQATQSSFLSKSSDSGQAQAVLTAYRDIKNAFLYYLEHHNGGNRIILASHSQGSYLGAMLLRDVFDSNQTLRNQLLVAALGGILCDFRNAQTQDPVWWDHISSCTNDSQTSCVISWRCFKKGQTIPPMLNSHIALNPHLLEYNVLKRTYNPQQDIAYQDSQSFEGLRDTLSLYIIPNGNQAYPGGGGFAAYDNRYMIQYQRQGTTSVGWMLEEINHIDEMRPNHLGELDQSSEFTLLGYHRRDYNIFIMRLVALIEKKLPQSYVPDMNKNTPTHSVTLYPNPTQKTVCLQGNTSEIANRSFLLFNSLGSEIFKGMSNPNGCIDLPQLKTGNYYLYMEGQTFKLMVQE